jgi:cell division septation protein DedD
MPVDSNKPQAAPRKPRKRVRKIGVESSVAAPMPPEARTAVETSRDGDARTERELRANRSARQPQVEQPMTVMLNGVLTPILPVSLREPAAPDARAGVRPAPLADENDWHWAGPPLAATFAFLATLGALLLGYWIGYSSATGGESALTVAEASEKDPTQQAPVTNPAVNPPAKAALASQAAVVEPKPAGNAPQAGSGLHLQVSALTSRSAASELQRQLEGRGFPVRIEAPTDDEYVRVYVGPVPDGSELKVWASRLRLEGLEPFPKRL